VTQTVSICSFCSVDDDRAHLGLLSVPTRRSSDLPEPKPAPFHPDACSPDKLPAWIRPKIACNWIKNSEIGKCYGDESSFCSRIRSEEHTSELQSRSELVCRLLLESTKT